MFDEELCWIIPDSVLWLGKIGYNKIMEKFINKDTLPTIVATVIIVIGILFQSQYFATKLDLSQLKNEVLQQKIELQKYSDDGDKEILKELDIKYDKIITKLDRIK